MDFSSLKPYLSLMLCELVSKQNENTLISDIFNDIKETLSVQAPRKTREIGAFAEADQPYGMTAGYLHYWDKRAPSWKNDSELMDMINHLVLVCKRLGHVAILFTDTKLSPNISRRFGGGNRGLSALKPIDTGLLNSAFADGPTRTLWLSGIHTRTSIKPDSKVISGSDLRDALDPLTDQSYYFTALRCANEFGEQNKSVGLSPQQSRIWMGPSNSWEDFCENVAAILKRLEEADKKNESNEAPIPILATHVTNPAAVRDAFDVSIVAPEVDANELDEEARKKHERWAFEARFEVISTDGPNLSAEVYLGALALGKLQIEVDFSNPKSIKPVVTTTLGSKHAALLEEAAQACRNRHWLQIRYESGHTLSDGLIYSTRYRDVRFDKWLFADFRKIDICKEKPGVRKSNRNKFDPALVGSSDSLFCWVWNNWPYPATPGKQRGWLACDDGAMEMADFIHLDSSESPPVLSLIHVKGSHSNEGNRKISVSDYEVVTSQAVKNLRFIDQLILEKGLSGVMRNEIGKLVLYNGKKQPDRKGMIKAIQKIGTSYRKRVVIVQPRVSQNALKAVRSEQVENNNSGNVVRLLQLETLLVEAENSCRALGAEFHVVVDNTPHAVQPRQKKSRKRAPRGTKMEI